MSEKWLRHLMGIIIDGTVEFLAGTPLEKYVTIIAKADGLIPSVSAASIIARWLAMDLWQSRIIFIQDHGDFLSSHVGYGKHREGGRGGYYCVLWA